jgi:uncharacterized protein
MCGPYVKSPFVSIIETDEGSVLYNSLTIKKTADSALVREFGSYAGGRTTEAVKKLAAGKFLVRRGHEREALNKIRRGKYFGSPRLNNLLIFLTNRCNFRCKYCFVDSTKRGGMDIPESTAVQSIDVFLRVAKGRDVKMTLYGGEPLLNFPIVRAIFEHLDRLNGDGKLKKRRLVVELITNASLMTDEIARFLKERGVTVTVSLDGEKSQHDAMRVYANGKGTYDDVMRGISVLCRNGVNPVIACTIGPHNIPRLKDAMKSVIGAGLKDIGLSPLKALPDHCQAMHDGAGIRQICDALEYLEGRGLQELRTTERLRRLKTRKAKLFGCSACGSQLSVTPDGKVGPCHVFADRNEFIIGNVNDADIVDKIAASRTLKDWSMRSPFLMDACSSCTWISVCGGGCAYDAYRSTGKIADVDKDFCDATAVMMRWAIGRRRCS